MQGQRKVPVRPLVTKTSIWRKGKAKKLWKPEGVSGKELFHFVGLYHQLPEELLLKWIMRATTGCVFGVVAAAWKSMFGLVQDPQLTMETSQTAIHDPDT